MGDRITAAPYYIGDCPCGRQIDGHDGVRVDPTGQRWHPDCRERHLTDISVPPEAPRQVSKGRRAAIQAPDAPAAA